MTRARASKPVRLEAVCEFLRAGAGEPLVWFGFTRHRCPAGLHDEITALEASRGFHAGDDGLNIRILCGLVDTD